MKKFAFLTTILTGVLVLVLPFIGGGGPGLSTVATADTVPTFPILASTVAASAPARSAVVRPAIATTTRVTEESAIADAAALTHDWEHLAQKPVPKPKPAPVQVVGVDGSYSGSYSEGVSGTGAQGCPGDSGGGVGGAPGSASAQGVAGTTSDDLASFAYQYNSIRVANCLEPIAYGNFYYDSCMEARLFWMAESPSPDPLDAWGHEGSVRADGVPSTGCDGNLAGGSGNSGATVAEKWWNSSSHRASLYRPGSGVGGACIAFAMTHGGIDEPYSFTRAAARWTGC